MASHSQGIQQLLAAEKKAADLVSAARKRKIKRLKQAKEEAVEEINAYRAEREKHFNEYQREHMGSKDDFQVKIDENTQIKLQEMTLNVNQNKDGAIKRILEIVYDISPELHQNYRI